ncbi:MAG TPA: carotenoid biosynthesis protein [Xanthobacteraceae bacterium]
MSARPPPMTRRVSAAVLWLLIAAYAAVTLVPDALPRLFRSPFNVPAAVLLSLCFGLLHGAIRYGIAGIAVLLALCLGVGNLMENIGVLTGFPFGHYHYTDALGPKLLLVPLLIGPAYFGSGYLSWVMANVLLRADRRTDALAVLMVPLAATFIMVSWDLCFDPAASTVAHMWIWEDGGGYFGVPLTNFLGWYLTVYIFLQLFAVYRARRASPAVVSLPRGYWYQACVMFAVMALDYPVTYLGSQNRAVTDATGRVWQTGDIYQTAAIVSLCTMLFTAFVGFAVVLLSDRADDK